MRLGARWALALFTTALAVPASASADTTYCVPSAAIPGCPAAAVGKATVSGAMAAVNSDATSAHDAITIGAGTYVEDIPADNFGH
jgi:hypothetical protein